VRALRGTGDQGPKQQDSQRETPNRIGIWNAPDPRRATRRGQLRHATWDLRIACVSVTRAMGTVLPYVLLHRRAPASEATVIGKTARGFLPVPFQASLWVEIAPGIAINRSPSGTQGERGSSRGPVVERAYGLLEVHDHDKGEVPVGRRDHPQLPGRREGQRLKPKILTNQIIRGVDAYRPRSSTEARTPVVLPASRCSSGGEPAGYEVLAATRPKKARTSRWSRTP